MLTPEQRALRRTGIGASELAAIVELHPYKEPLDVWLRKPTPSRPPLIEEEEDDDRAQVGDALEDGLRALYARRTGIAMTKPTGALATARHRSRPCILASPDGIADAGDIGLEVKVVGSRMAHHWADDSIPDYVVAQAVQGMAVYDLPRWDVVALLHGTELRIESILRDLELEEMMLDAACAWWVDHIEHDDPPPAIDSAARRRYLRARYPGSDRTKCRRVDDEVVAALAATLEETDERLAQLKEEREETVAALCELVGNDYGIEGDFGRFLWIPNRGAVSWKAVAEELAGGVVPEHIIEKHRGEPFRSPRFYSATTKARRR